MNSTRLKKTLCIATAALMAASFSDNISYADTGSNFGGRLLENTHSDVFAASVSSDAEEATAAYIGTNHNSTAASTGSAPAFSQGKKKTVCENVYKANDDRIAWIGRTVSEENGSVAFQWSGVMTKIKFKGRRLGLKCSDSKKNWFNVWIDSDFSAKEDAVFTTCKDSTICIADGLKYGEHEIIIQRRTEGEQGLTHFHEFITDGELLPVSGNKERLIEFIGDSYTCGYGTESASRNDPFKPETENCNLAYGCITARCFNADYILVSHSGQGIARNYNGGHKGYTMVERYSQAFDEVKEPLWDARSHRKPDVVVIFLGTNDFSCGEQPTLASWKSRFEELLGKVKANYGENIPVVCMASKQDFTLLEFLKDAAKSSRYKNVCFAGMFDSIVNDETELGASWHPNYQGQRKFAMVLIPYISTVTGWELPADMTIE